MDVVPEPLIKWMRLDANRDDQVPRLRTWRSRIPLARHTNLRPISDTRWHHQGQPLRLCLHTTPGAPHTPGSWRATCPTAQVAWLREDHVSARRLDDPAALALDALLFKDLQRADALAHATVNLSGRRHVTLNPADGILEDNDQRLVKIDATTRFAARMTRTSLPQHVAKEIAEGRGTRTSDAHREVKSLETKRHRAVGSGMVPLNIVLSAPVRIAQRLICLGNALKSSGRNAISRVDVRMIAPCQATVCSLDFRERRLTPESQYHIEVHGISVSLRLALIHDLGIDDVSARSRRLAARSRTGRAGAPSRG